LELKRKIYNNLLQWKKEQGKTALLIEGARRVGKTTVVKAFAENEYQSYILIDFSIASDEMKSIFTRHASSLDDFFFFLSTLTNTTLFTRDTLIIFDEVQLFPQARQLIKHLVKDNRYDYVETGSLLSIKQNVKDIPE
jgi:predicted AAA+ superfamily ATPase